MTPLEISLATGAILLLLTGAWRLIEMRDRIWLLLFALYLGWFPLAVLLRGATADLKASLAYVAFAGVSGATAFAAIRSRHGRMPGILVSFLAGALLVSFALAVVERITYPGEIAADPLEPLWRLFRPAETYLHPRLGLLGPAKLHFPLPGGGIRATGPFFHTNYLAFFGILVTPLMTALALRDWRTGRRVGSVLALIGLAVAAVLTYWTYSRAGLLGISGAVAATLVLDLLWQWRRRHVPARQALVPGLGVGLTFAAVMTAAFVIDDVGLRRLGATGLADPVVSEVPYEPGVEGTAGRAGQLRIRLQRVALEEIVASPLSLLWGPGLARYESAIHDPASPHHIPEAIGIRDPNSLWLTVGLAGGLPAMVLLGGLLSVTWVRLLRSLGPDEAAGRAALVLWLGAWIPVWALAQLVGTNPFSSAEAIILGTVLGLAGGVSRRADGSARRGAAQPSGGIPSTLTAPS